MKKSISFALMMAAVLGAQAQNGGITPDMLAFTRADGSFGSEPGLFRVMIGNSSVVSEHAEFTLE